MRGPTVRLNDERLARCLSLEPLIQAAAERSHDAPGSLDRSSLGDGSLPIIYPASLGHELDQNSINQPSR